ncbi:MAG: GyrI-like domain-containing protein [Hyphomicrobiaceae bacterium]|nr:MAG: GyrI-like domain-containing protein [Hyphomicrobiaceae bacterium]
MRVNYRYIRPLTVLYARSMGPYVTSAPEAWQRLNRWLEQHNARRAAKMGYGIFRDNPTVTEPDLIRYDACVGLIGDLDADPEAGIGRQTLPGGAYAVHVHVGSYDEIGRIFSSLHRDLVPRRGLSVDYERPFVAIYLNDPMLTREVHRRTELCVPVIPIRMPLSGNDNVDEDAAIRIPDGSLAGFKN